MEQKPTAGKGVLCVIRDVALAILIFLFLLIGLLAATVEKATSEKTVEDVVDNIELYRLYSTYMEEEVDDKIDLTKGLEDLIVDGEQYDLSKKDVEALVECKEVKSFLKETLNDYISSFKEGKNKAPFTKKKVLKLFQNMDDRLTKVVGSYAAWDYVAIEEELNNISFEDFSVDALLDEAPEGTDTAISLLRYLLVLAIVLFVLAAGLIALLVFLNRSRIHRALLASGIPAMLAGLIPVVLFLILPSNLGFLENATFESIASDVIDAMGLPGPASYIVLILGALALIAGIAMMVFRSLRNKQSKATDFVAPQMDGNLQ